MDTMPADVHAQVNDYFHKSWDAGETNPEATNFLGRATGERRLVPLTTELRSVLESTLLEMVGEWSGLGAENIEATNTYGIRAYLKNSTLKTHVDRVETHILSVVYCVDASYPTGARRWHMEADPDLSGKHVSVDIAPGKIFYYESAKLTHGK
jgi:hypothetical protein